MTSLDRRRMFRWLGGSVAAMSAVLPSRLFGAHPEIPMLLDAPENAWLAALAGRSQKAFLDIRSFTLDGTPFRRAQALLSALTTSYGLRSRDVGIAFGAHSTALAYLLAPAFWKEYDVANKVAGSLRSAEADALRAAGPGAATVGLDGVRDLRANGIRVLACRNTIARWSRELAAATSTAPDAVQRKIEASLHDGVEMVPAMIAAAVLAQSRGLGYVAVE